MTTPTPEPIHTPTPEQVDLARDWHGGMATMLYAVASTGALSRGSEAFRPARCSHGDDWRYLSDRQWSHSLVTSLAAEVGAIARDATDPDDQVTADAWHVELVALAASLDDPDDEDSDDGAPLDIN